MRQKIGFWTGLLLFVVVAWIPESASFGARPKMAAAAALWMAVWWVTEAVALALTSLIPLVIYPVFNVLNIGETAKKYIDPNIFLFMGGFMLALAMQKSELHKRIALLVISAIGEGRRRMLGGFLAATALISMWVSNTATCLMILPIGLAVVSKLSDGGRRDLQGFDAALMLAIAYASSIGGVATLIGSPPNMILAGQVKNLFPELPEIGFVNWFFFAAPMAFGFLLLTWLYLSLVLVKRSSDHDLGKGTIRQELKNLGKVSSAEIRVACIFFLTVIGWIWRVDIQIGSFKLPGWPTLLHLKGTHDAAISMLAALFLFITPSGASKRDRLLDWKWAKKIPWGVLILFGGGFALAESFQSTGLAEGIAGGFLVLEEVPLFWFVLILCLAATFLSELMSNTAQVMLMIPILAATSKSLGVHPFCLMMPATMAASLAFMMPVGTPPNAIVFGSGHVSIPQMARTGFFLNLLGAVWIACYSFAFLKHAFILT